MLARKLEWAEVAIAIRVLRGTTAQEADACVTQVGCRFALCVPIIGRERRRAGRSASARCVNTAAATHGERTDCACLIAPARVREYYCVRSSVVVTEIMSGRTYFRSRHSVRHQGARCAKGNHRDNYLSAARLTRHSIARLPQVIVSARRLRLEALECFENDNLHPRVLRRSARRVTRTPHGALSHCRAVALAQIDEDLLDCNLRCCTHRHLNHCRRCRHVRLAANNEDGGHRRSCRAPPSCHHCGCTSSTLPQARSADECTEVGQQGACPAVLILLLVVGCTDEAAAARRSIVAAVLFVTFDGRCATSRT